MSVLTRIADMRGNVAAAAEIYDLLSRQRPLLLEMTRRELKDRYAGSALGLGWAVGAPLAIFAANILAFMLIFRVRLNAEDGGASYATYVLAGMAPWIAIGDVLGRAPGAVQSSANLVKQIVFPSEILPMKIVLASLPGLAIGCFVVMVLSLFSGHATVFGFAVLFPVATVYFVIMITGFAYALAAIGVFLRDVKEFVALMLSIGLFLHPILYPPGAVPQWLQLLFNVSPFSYVILCFREALFDGRIVNPANWIVTPVLGAIFAILGWRVFRMLRPTFGNAL